MNNCKPHSAAQISHSVPNNKIITLIVIGLCCHRSETTVPLHMLVLTTAIINKKQLQIASVQSNSVVVSKKSQVTT